MANAEQLITENLDLWSSTVKAKSSAGRGSSKKLELYGISKLRELILDLAVRGMLVQQDPSERKASDCLASSNPGISNFSPSPNILRPNGWIQLPLGCVIAGNTGGGTPKKNEPIYWDGNINWASVKDIQSSKYITSTIDKITQEGLKNSSSNLIPPNRLIVVTRMGLGKLAINKIPIAINQDLRAIEPTDALDLDYGYLLIKSLKFIGKGMTVKGITVKQLHDTKILLPPLAEQHRIVAKVDELMALCDQLEEEQENNLETHEILVSTLLNALSSAATDAAQFADAWERIKDNFDILFTTENSIDQLKQTILQLAVMGKLVPQDQQDEPSQVLLGRIANERARLIKEKKIKNSKCSLTNDAWSKIRIPTIWQLTTLGNVADWGSGSTPKRENQNHYGGSLTWLKSGELNDCQALRGSSEKITEEAVKAGSFRRNIIGDILIAMYGATIGKAAILDETAYTNQAVCGCTPFEGVFNRYLFFYLISQRKNFHAASEGGAQPNISKVKLLGYPLPLPPLAEQHRIVAKVDELFTLCDHLKARLYEVQKTQLTLADSIVERAIPPPA